MRVDISLDLKHNLSKEALDDLRAELHRRVLTVFPATKVILRSAAVPAIEMAGFNLASDRETLDQILQEVLKLDPEADYGA
ncbi:DinI-like family protein [Erwinia aphidicola]|uniref:DinI-like family protein n=1 Tax=Erwinia aphidicola TaxID=68334 RepID=UPI00301B291B